MVVAIAKFAKLVKSVAVLKPLIVLASAFASVFAYSFMLGWGFAVGFVAMLFVHEMGHVMAAKARGFKTSAPIFIPFVGALITMSDMGDREDEAFIGIGGPLVGGLAAMLLMVPIVLLKHPPAILIGVCYTALFVNLFNLVPVRPLDGGRVLQATGDFARYAAGAGALLLPFLLRQPFFFIIWIIALSHIQMSRKNRLLAGLSIQAMILVLCLERVWGSGTVELIIVQIAATIINWGNYLEGTETPVPKDLRPHLPVERRWMWAGAYLGLATMLIWAMVVTHHHLLPASVR